MKNVLLITTIYPLPKDNRGTSVCHYFTREWLKMGYNVRVVHYQAVYPLPLYWIARLNRKKIAARTGAVVYTERDKGGTYQMDGVPVKRIPLFKPIPHGGYTRRTISKSIKEITGWLGHDGFTPDVIIGHFPNPQIELVNLLHEHYPQSKTCIVMHGDIEIVKKVYGDRLAELCKKINVWGFRNPAVQRSFEKRVMKVEKAFMCYSGIPEDYITTANTHHFDNPVPKVVYVGEMIERKYPVEVMTALEKAYSDGNYQLTYVGDGLLLGKIKEQVNSGAVKGKVNVLGKIPRDSIKAQYDDADIMVMISRGEAFGLVYLEAMSRGCITIASRNEGFDGIIVDGENGFLCKAGDADELVSIFQRIGAMTKEEKMAMSQEAIETAQSLTDYKAAKRYIEDVEKLMESC